MRWSMLFPRKETGNEMHWIKIILIPIIIRLVIIIIKWVR